MPLFSVFPAAISSILYIIGIAVIYPTTIEAGMVMLFFPLYLIVFIAIYAIVSLFLATLVYLDFLFYRITIISLIILFFAVTMISLINYSINCGGLEGCTQNNLACFAYKSDNASICERGNESAQTLILSTSKAYIRGYKIDCFVKLALLKNDPLVCEKSGDLKLLCQELFSGSKTYILTTPLPDCK
jgi:uncharacterized protein YacL